MLLPSPDRISAYRKAIIEARRLSAHLQGTMSLEGQGLDKKSLRKIQKRMARRLLL